MTVVLRDYQERAVNEVREAFMDGHRAVLFQLATGGGKTLTAGHILGSAAQKSNPGMFICNRVELLEQTAVAFDKLGISYGVIAAGFTPNIRAMVQIASIDTLKRRLDKIRIPKLVVWDECRSLGSAGWTKVFKTFPDAVHLGLDATPVRLDGKGLGNYFTHLVCGPTYSELKARGSLVPFELYSVGMPDLSAVHTSKGEFDQAEVEALVDTPSITGDIAQQYLKYANGKLGITFAVSRKHSEHLAASYRAAGVAALHLDGDTDKAERKRAVAAFRRREIQVLCNVDLFTAGFDVPGVEVITMARPTQSLAVYLQQAGRGSRPEGEKTHCILLDHVGNWIRHGLPDADRTWTLEGRKPRQKKAADDPSVQVKQCEGCFRVFWPPPVCPYCGHVHKVQGREIEEREGELRKITAEEAARINKAKKVEVWKAQTLEELERIEAQRGYKPGWARAIWSTKQNASQRRAEAQARAYGRLSL